MGGLRGRVGTLAEYLRDPATPQDLVALVEHSGLAGGYGPLGFRKLDEGSIGGADFDARRRGHVLVANLDLGLEGFTLRDRSNPVHLAHRAAAMVQLLVSAYHNAVAHRVELNHVERLTCCHA